MAAKSPLELYQRMVADGMNPDTPVNAPSHSVWVQDNEGWKLHSGRDGSNGFNRFSYMPKYKNALLTENGNDAESTLAGMDDYDLFNAIHYSPSAMGRDNYTEGEEEGIWNELSKYFDLPKYNPYMYSFGVNDKDRKVELNKNGVAGGGGFGDWIVKPQFLGPLVRRK